MLLVPVPVTAPVPAVLLLCRVPLLPLLVPPATVIISLLEGTARMKEQHIYLGLSENPNPTHWESTYYDMKQIFMPNYLGSHNFHQIKHQKHAV